MALVLTIGGVNRTSVAKYGSLAVEQQAANFITVCSLVLIDEAGDIDIIEEDTITLIDGATTYFTGRIVEIRYSLFTICSRYIKLKCQDPNYQLLETVIDQEEEFPGGGGHGGITADSRIIDHLFDGYLPGVTTDDFAKNQTLQDPLTITFSPCTLRSMLSQICTRTGGYFYIDFDDDLHYFEAETSGVAWWLTDDPIRDAPATNLITNPSIEVDTTSWPPSGSAISRDTALSRFGSASLKVITDNVGAVEGAYSVVTGETVASTEYTFSCYLRGTGTVRLLIWDNTGGDQYGPIITLTNVWTRYEWTATFSTGAARAVAVYTNVQQDTTFWGDGFQLEARASASSYFDGSFGADFAWTGAAHDSTSTRGAGATSFFEAFLDKTTLATTRLDGVFVIGADVSGWRGTHAPGDRQGIARDNRITTATGVQNRGDAVLARYGDAQETYTVKIYQAGLRAGMVVLFICELYGVNGTFTVRKMVIKWDECGDAYYVLTLGDVVNPSLITERNWIDGLVSGIGPITTPMLPTSSRGWSHDIVFSATDNDTVEWAGGNDIILADGSTYTINAGNTGNMAEVHYIYLDIDIAINALQVTHNAATAVGTHKVLVAVAEDVGDAAKDALFQVFGGPGQSVFITADHIAANTITFNEIAGNTINAGNIAAGAIETDELNALAVTAAKIAANTITADKISMGIGDALFNNADGLLLLGPHCEISPTEWWSLRKQLATLSGAFHQEAGRWQGTRGLAIEGGSTNLIKNPSFETNLTSWALVDLDASVTRTRSTEQSRQGGYSVKMVNADAGDDDYTLYNLAVAASTTYTITAWVRVTDFTAPAILDRGLFVYDGFATDATTITAANGQWERHELTITTNAGAANLQIRLYAPQGTIYWDGIQVESLAYSTTYIDGSLGTGYAWTGAAHGSTSTRAATALSIPATDLIEIATGTFACWVKPLIDWNEANHRRLFNAVAFFDFTKLNHANGNIYFFYGVGQQVISGALAWEKDRWYHIVATWTNGSQKIYRDGVEIASGTYATPVLVPGTLTIGGDVGANHSAALWAEVATFQSVLTAIEVQGLYALTTPLVDVGPLDSPGIFLLDGKFKLASSTTGNRIEIEAGAISGYDSAGTLQFELRSSDGKAQCGGGKVNFDENGIWMLGAGATANPRMIRSLYNDAGAYRVMSRFFGNYTGAGLAYSWLETVKGAGDPWNGTVVLLKASDDVTGADVRVSIQSDRYIIVTGTYQFGVNALLLPGRGGADPVNGVENGALYYRDDTHKLRLRANGAWVDLN